MQIAQLVRLVKDQHLEAVLWEALEIEPRAVVCRDDRPDFILGIGVEQLPTSGDRGGDAELRLKLLFPLGAEQFWRDYEDSFNPPARDELFDDVYGTLPWNLREQREAMLKTPQPKGH